MLSWSPRPKRFDSPQQEVFLNLWRTYDRLRALEDELFGRHGLTAQQYNALRLLRAAHPGKVPTLALATRLVSRAPDITRLLDKLARPRPGRPRAAGGEPARRSGRHHRRGRWRCSTNWRRRCASATARSSGTWSRAR